MRRRRALPRSSRRGVAIVLVLGLLVMTLSVSYAMIHMQTMSVTLDANYRRMGDARLAAMTGMSAALRTIHQDSWAGVGTSISGNLGDGLSYIATYTAGDTSLSPGDPDYGDLPYRVTIRCTGSSEHPQQAGLASKHVIETVVQLVPRALQATPSNWSKIQGHTLFQWGTDPCVMEVPSQIDGSISTQGAITFASKYPLDDQRPFHGHIDEVAIIKKALTATEILAIHNATLGVGASPESLILGHSPVAYWRFNESVGATTASDAMSTYPAQYVSANPGQTPKPFSSAGKSAFFDGRNDNVYCGNFNVTGNKLTILCWFRPDSFPGDTRLVSKAAGPSDSDQYWGLGTVKKPPFNYLRFWVRADGDMKDAEATVGNVLPGQWTFAAGVFDGQKVRVFKDGSELKNNGFNEDSMDTSSNALVVIGDAPPGSSRARLMFDYTAMKKAALGEQRPVVGNWAAPAGKLSSEAQSLISDELEGTTSTISTDNTAPSTFPVAVNTYQLYKGGPVYSAQAISSSVLQNTSLSPDPKTNPLGIFRYKGSLTIRDNVSIQGTVVLNDTTGDKITFETGSVTWSAVDLSLLDSETASRQLPIAMVPKEFFFKKEITSAQLTGLVVCGDKFEFEVGGSTPRVTLDGALVTKWFNLWERNYWPTSIDTWRLYLRDFLKQKDGNGGIAYFPQWLSSSKSLVTTPQISIKTDGSGRIYHWPDFSKPIFQKQSSDEGLRWRIVTWKDGA